jgi:hypothetical protein
MRARGIRVDGRVRLDSLAPGGYPPHPFAPHPVARRRAKEPVLRLLPSRLLVCLATLTALSNGAQAGPIALGGSVSGAFVNPLDGVSSGADTPLLQFGTPTPSTVAFNPSTSFNVWSGAPFVVGTLAFANLAMADQTTGATFRTTIDFDPASGLGSASFDFRATFTHDPATGAARLLLGSTALTGSVTVNGTPYRLNLLGLSAEPTASDGAGALDVQLGATASGYLWGQFSEGPDDTQTGGDGHGNGDPDPAEPEPTPDPPGETPPGVPEPGTLVLGLLALAAGARARARAR